jgi:hypothetical protein
LKLISLNLFPGGKKKSNILDTNNE